MVGRTFQMEGMVGLKATRKRRDWAPPPTPPIPLARIPARVSAKFLGGPKGHSLSCPLYLFSSSFLPFSLSLVTYLPFIYFFPNLFPFIFPFLQSPHLLKKNFIVYLSLPTFFFLALFPKLTQEIQFFELRCESAIQYLTPNKHLPLWSWEIIVA